MTAATTVSSAAAQQGTSALATCRMAPSAPARVVGNRRMARISGSKSLRGTPCISKPAAARPAAARASTVTVRAEADGEFDYDFFCIGGGSGGVRASRMASSYGAKVAMAEMPYAYISSDEAGGLGGTCVLRGCVPKKLLVYGSEFSHAFKDAEGFGWNGLDSPKHDWTTLLEKKRAELDRLNGIYGRMLDNAGVEIIEGRGTVVDANTVEVAGKQYTAKYILIGTGGKPFSLPIPGVEHSINSDAALELPECPKKILIVGAGYIAVEFAGIFNGFGAEVHLAYRKDLPLNGFDEEVRGFATEQYAQSGLNLHPGTSPKEIVKNDDGSLTVTMTTPGGEVTDTFDQVMMATGRTPNSRGLGLEEAGVKLNGKGAVEVDEYSRTAVPSIYAVGDVTDRINLTPVALMEGMAVAKTLFLNEPSLPDHANVASAVFSQPPIACVGLTEEQAIEESGDVDIYTSSFRPMKNTISGAEGRAFMKILVDANTDKVLGMHMVGDDSAEIMQGMAVAVKMGATKAQLDSCVGIHPSSAEEFVTMRSASRKVRNKQPVE